MVIKWHLAALTALSLVGVGVYAVNVLLGCIKGKGGEIRPPAFLLAAVFLCASVTVTTLTIGNPSRILNVLGNLKSGFSMAFASSFVLLLISVYLFFLIKKQERVKTWAISFLGMVFSLIIMFGVSEMYMKFSRPALDGWFIPCIFIGYAFLAGILGYSFMNDFSKNLAKTAYVALLIQCGGFVWFIINLASIGLADRYLSISRLFFGDIAPYFYIFIIFLGIIVPFISIFLAKKGKISGLLTMAAFICQIVGGGGFIAVINLAGL